MNINKDFNFIMRTYKMGIAPWISAERPGPLPPYFDAIASRNRIIVHML